MKTSRIIATPFIFISALVMTLPVWAVEDTIDPEASSAVSAKTAVYANNFLVTAANPMAVEAGVEVLEYGGNAIDAAIAVQMVLNVVEPQSSGIGGGGFMLYYDAATKEITVYDGRETAPAGADNSMFLDDSGQPRPFFDVVKGGLSVGTPGVLHMLWQAHQEHGAAPWNTLFSSAISLAEQGFPVPPRLHENAENIKHIREFLPVSEMYLQHDGSAKATGTFLSNQELARVFRTVAEEGITPFYRGRIADDIVETVQQSAINAGKLAISDMESYESKKRALLCIPYRAYRVCSMPPPSSGGLTILQTLGMLSHFDIAAMPVGSHVAMHTITEATRLAFADRNAYIGDPDFVDVPMEQMLSPTYLEKRAALIDPKKALEVVSFGTFKEEEEYIDPFASSSTIEEQPSTTHISIVDAEGNAVTFTSSIEYAFGSGLMVRGFLLNNQLTDFAFQPNEGEVSVANRVEAGKRPRSSMSPTFVFNEEGYLHLVIGSPGGARIIPYVLQTIVGVLDWGMDVQTAINQPHFVTVGGPIELEEGTSAEHMADRLIAMGHRVEVKPLTSGLHGIEITPQGLIGGADPRRDGVAMGE